MYIYLIVFAISVCILSVAEKCNRKRARLFLVLISILIPSLLAGLRADSVGTDTTVYGISFYQRALSAGNIIDYLQTQVIYNSTDAGFSIIVYVCSLISKDYHFGFFIYQLLTLIFIYCGAFRYKKLFETPVSLVVLLYYLSLYNTSLNIMRQTIAAAIIFFASSYIWERRYKVFIILTLIAITVHSSAIIGLAFLPIYLISKQGDTIDEIKQLRRCIYLVVAIMIILVYSSRIVNLLVTVGIFRSNYLNYLSGGTYSNSGQNTSVAMIVLAIQICYILAFVFNHRRLQYQSREPLFFEVVSGIVLLSSCFGPVVADYISRMSYFFIPVQMVGLVNTSFCFSTRKGSRTVWVTGIIILVGMTWIRSIAIHNFGETLPYLFFWQ